MIGIVMLWGALALGALVMQVWDWLHDGEVTRWIER